MAKEPEKPDDDPVTSALWDHLARRGKQTPQVGIQQVSPRMDAQWKAVFYESVQPRALHLQDVKVGMLCKKKAQQEKAEKKVPPDRLSRKWFDEEAMTLETRAYLLDKLLPTLVPGVEKLLKVAERKKVLEVETEEELSKFDPINFLGEYLMRCNPSYAISALSDPYVTGIKAVTEELKAKVPETTPNKLAQLKELVKEKRKQREQVEEIKNQVKAMRKKALAVQFREWTLDTNSQIPLALIQSALKSFLDMHTLPTDTRGGLYARSLETIETLEVKLNEEEFAEELRKYHQIASQEAQVSRAVPGRQ